MEVKTRVSTPTPPGYSLLEGLYKFSDRVNSVLSKVVFVLFFVATILTIIQVFNRFVLHAALPWSEEVIRFLFIWFVFLGIAMCVHSQSNVRVQTLIIFMPKKLRNAFLFVANILCMYFFFILVDQGIKIAILNQGQLAPSTQISMTWPYLAIPVGAVFMILFTIPQMLKQLMVILYDIEEDKNNELVD